VHAGGSGCGCCASVTAAYFLPRLLRGELRRVLLMATGALMSPSSLQQGESIVGIAPIVRMEVIGE
jgi:stage V sporulation protein AD